MLQLLLLFTVAFTGVTPECDPEVADNCFTEVQSDLKFMLNLPHAYAKDVSKSALDDLCMALDDSLNCTSDIIDEDCDEDEGRERFDAWLRALRGAYDYACGDNHMKMKDILKSVRCWNVDDFLQCTMETANLNHIKELLQMELDEEECEDLRVKFKSCKEDATQGSCREEGEVEDDVDELIMAFFDASHCAETIAASINSGAILQSERWRSFGIYGLTILLLSSETLYI